VHHSGANDNTQQGWETRNLNFEILNNLKLLISKKGRKASFLVACVIFQIAYVLNYLCAILMSMKKSLLLGVLGTLLVFHLLASWFGWYLTHPWVDIISHTLGGSWIGLALAVYVPLVRGMASGNQVRWYEYIGVVVGGVAVVGVGWEWFEYGVAIIGNTANLIPLSDTLGDLFFDMVGGVLAALISLRVVG
jgi:hypothetical protein